MKDRIYYYEAHSLELVEFSKSISALAVLFTAISKNFDVILEEYLSDIFWRYHVTS